MSEFVVTVRRRSDVGFEVSSAPDGPAMNPVDLRRPLGPAMQCVARRPVGPAMNSIPGRRPDGPAMNSIPGRLPVGPAMNSVGT
jgi:hypothetical protein